VCAVRKYEGKNSAQHSTELENGRKGVLVKFRRNDGVGICVNSWMMWK